MQKRVFITVLTYPTPSHKYIETVCTAGITEEGQWIRIYPIQLRMLNTKIRKYSWYTFNIEPRSLNKDIRRESYFCIDPPKESDEHIGTDDFWRERKRICLKNIFNSYKVLEEASDIKKNNFISLATFKPKEIIDFVAEPKDLTENDKIKAEIIENLQLQGELLERADIPEYWKMAQSIPFTFYYIFKDSSDKEIKLMLEDWETMMLYLNCRNKGEEQAIEKVRQKYLYEFKERDLYFFLGTRKEAQIRNWKKPYSIVGVFYPPKNLQSELNFEI